MNRFFYNGKCIRANPAGKEPPTPQPTRLDAKLNAQLRKPFDPKNPPRGICEICLDPKHKTQHCEAHGRIHYVHQKCYAKAHEKLSKFIDLFYINDFKDIPKEQRAIWLWLHDSW